MTRHTLHWHWRTVSVAVTLAVVGVATDALAQSNPPPTRKVSASVVGGVNFASLSVPLALPIPEVDVSMGRRVGFVGGALVEVPVAPGVTFDTGVLFSQRGMTMKASSPLFGSAEGDFLIPYLDVPAHVRIGVAGAGRTRVSLVAGPTVGIKLDARSHLEAAGQSMDMDFTSELPAVDLGVAVGGRLDVGRALVVVSYLFGLTDTTKGDAPESVKHRVWSIVAGWRF